MENKEDCSLTPCGGFSWAQRATAAQATQVRATRAWWAPQNQVSTAYLLDNGALPSCLIHKGPYSSTKLSVSTLCWTQEAGKSGSLPPSLLRGPSLLPRLGPPGSLIFPEQPAACLSSLRSASHFTPACPSRSLIQ